MVPTPLPSPTVFVQLISQDQTPWWWSGALTGFFVRHAAVVAFLSLRASDKQKLAREDRRQWDNDLMSLYLDATVQTRVVRSIRWNGSGEVNSERQARYQYVSNALEQLEVIQSDLSLIAERGIQNAKSYLVRTVHKIANRYHDAIIDKDAFRKLYYDEKNLLNCVKSGLGVSD